MPRRRAIVLEEYALYLDRRERYVAAHERYRELLRLRQHDLHIQRRFAQSLMNAAAGARDSGNRSVEDANLSEGRRVLQRILEIAPEDKWAAEALHRAENRIYI
jgi:hypothetical protein